MSYLHCYAFHTILLGLIKRKYNFFIWKASFYFILPSPWFIGLWGVVKGRMKERTDTVRGEIFKYNFDGQSRTSIQGVKNDTDLEVTNLPTYILSLFNLTLEHE